MILEKNFKQIQHDEATKYIAKTAHRYSSESEKLIAFNAYLQGRVEAVSDMEGLVNMYNQMLDERNKLAKELAALKAKDVPEGL